MLASHFMVTGVKYQIELLQLFGIAQGELLGRFDEKIVSSIVVPMHHHKSEMFDAFNMPPCSLEPVDAFDAREWRRVHGFVIFKAYDVSRGVEVDRCFVAAQEESVVSQCLVTAFLVDD